MQRSKQLESDARHKSATFTPTSKQNNRDCHRSGREQAVPLKPMKARHPTLSFQGQNRGVAGDRVERRRAKAAFMQAVRGGEGGALPSRATVGDQAGWRHQPQEL
jgi:hypothetical protein